MGHSKMLNTFEVGLWVWGLGIRVKGLGCGVPGLGFQKRAMGEFSCWLAGIGGVNPHKP